MNKLLLFLMENFSFLYEECGCRFADSQVYEPNATLVFEVDDLRLRFVRDRSQIFVDFQNKRNAAQQRWYSFGVVRQLLTGEIGGSEALDGDKARFIRQHLGDIKQLFSGATVKDTEKKLTGFEHARGERLFGK
jgi:hypothetical protein